MSMTYIMAMVPELKDVRRIGMLAKRIHGKDLDIEILAGKIEPDPVHGAIYMEAQNGIPRLRVDWQIATRNPGLAGDRYAWERAIMLYWKKPYFLAWIISWIDFWRTRHGKRVKIVFMKNQAEMDAQKEAEEQEKEVSKE